MSDTPGGSADPAAEYTRRLYANVVEWYKNADAKGQVLLTLDGGFLALLAGRLFEKPELIACLQWYTLLYLGLMAVALAASIYHAVQCLWSRTYARPEVERMLADAANPSGRRPEAGMYWFFQTIAALDRAAFESRMKAVTPGFEAEQLATQIHALSVRVTAKHYHVNRGFLYAGATLLMFLLAAGSFVLGVRA